MTTGAVPYRGYVVQTGSMKPTIPPESLVIVQLDKYKVGQVITFYKGSEVVSHRLIAVNPDGSLSTKGDANQTDDPLTINRADVIGGVVSSIKGLGFWAMYFKNPLTYFLIVLAVFDVALIWSFVADDESDDKTRVDNASLKTQVD